MALHAPITGLIVAVHATVGQHVQTETPVFSLLNTETVLIEAQLPEADLARLGPSYRAIYETLQHQVPLCRFLARKGPGVWWCSGPRSMRKPVPCPWSMRCRILTGTCGSAWRSPSTLFIIQAQAEIGGNGVHFGDQKLFAELMLMHEIRSYEEARAAPGLVFFDRGVPELVGYLPMVGRVTRPHFVKAAELYRYNRTVFIAPPWREIFANDAERKQDWNEAVKSYEWCVKTYRETGYELVELPKASVGERVRFVLGRVVA